jgi:hypothetical protein
MLSYKAESHPQTSSVEKIPGNADEMNNPVPQTEHTWRPIDEAAANHQAVESLAASGDLDRETAETAESWLCEAIKQFEAQTAADQEQRETTEHPDDAGTEGSVSEQEQRKRKPERSLDETKLSKRLCIDSGDVHRKQYTSPFESPFQPTERMQQIEKHERKRNLNYISNRDSTIYRTDGSRNNTSIEAHIVQERGEIHESRCNSCGNEKRPAGPWKECVSLKGFLHGSCANCHSSGAGARCSLRCKFNRFLDRFHRGPVEDLVETRRLEANSRYS